MKKCIAFTLLCFVFGIYGQPHRPLTREWVFVWVDDEPASANEHHVSRVFGVDLAAAVENFQNENTEAIVICAARVGDGRCFRKSNITY